jgi:hypothetical protein
MQDKIFEIEKKISLLQQEVTDLKGNYGRLQHIEKEIHAIKNVVTKMEMIDKSIFERLDMIVKAVDGHKESFVKHDEKEMAKYGSIEGRLSKIERILYMMMGAGLLFELLHKFDYINIGG